MTTAQRVLLIDDEPELRRATAGILRAADFEVWEAGSGEDGVLRAGDLPDLVLCDVQLPDIDGFEVCRRLRSHPDTASLPVLFMSGVYRDAKDRVRGLREGADGFLVRPVPPDELVSTVRVLLRRRAREGDTRAAAALAEVGRQLARTSTEPEALQRITGTIRALFGARLAVLYEHLAEHGLRCVAVAGEHGREAWLDARRPPGAGVAAQAVERRDLVVVAADGGDEAVAAAPLVAYGEVVGVLALVDHTARAFPAAERQLLATFADICALAAHNARLYATSQRALEHTQLLLSVVSELTAPSSSVEVMRRAARLVCRVLDADTAAFFALDARSGDVAGFAGYHVPPVLLRAPLAFGVAEVPEIFREAIQRGAPLLCPDVRNDPRLDHPLVRKMPLTPSALVAFPVAGDRGTRGVLVCYWWTTTHHVEPDEIRLAVGIADQLARALEHLRLSDEADRQRREAEFIADLAAKLNTSLHLDAVLQQVTQGALELCRSDVAWTTLRDPESGEVIVRHRVGVPDGEALATGLSVPITIAGTLAGALDVGNCSGRAFDERDEAVLARLASHAAIALQNATLFQASEAHSQRAQDAYDELRRTQSELLQSQKMEALGRLSGGIAHDFNNLLTVIGGRADLIRRSAPAESAARRDADLIAATNSRAAALTKQLLAFSRRQVSARHALDVNGVMRGLWPLLTRLIGEQVEMTFTAGLDPAVVMADTSQLEQVVLNLCVNARDAMPGGGRLELATEAVTLPSAAIGVGLDLAPGAYVHLAVRDTGMGMDADTLQRIFDPFFTTKEPGQGTGLGLATVYGVVRQSGGAVTAESAPGRGSTFHVLLPVADREAETLAQMTALPELRGGTETVLLVEDDADVRRFVRDVVEELGYRVLEAERPKAARALLQTYHGPIHLLLSDVVMPEESGPVLAAALRASFPGLRVIYMSGYAAELAQHAINDAGVLFLQKPFAPLALSEAIRKALD